MKERTWYQGRSQEPGDIAVGQGQKESGSHTDLGVNSQTLSWDFKITFSSKQNSWQSQSFIKHMLGTCVMLRLVRGTVRYRGDGHCFQGGHSLVEQKLKINQWPYNVLGTIRTVWQKRGLSWCLRAQALGPTHLSLGCVILDKSLSFSKLQYPFL